MKEILITSSVLIVALLMLRLIFGKKVRCTLIYAAWALVALRLLIPVQIGQLDFSVLTVAQPLTETVTEVSGLRVIGQNEREAESQVILEYIERDQTVFNPETQIMIQESLERNESKEEIATHISKTQSPENTFVPEVQQQVAQQVTEQTNFVSIGQLATIIWLAGVAVMAAWFAIVNLRHGRMLRRNREKLECDSPIPVYVSEKVGSPCLVGLFRPVIYLTPQSAADEAVRRHVLTHELTHYRHGDHIWSWVRCICLCVYWFDPLVWAAAWCSRRDCELACDEGALSRLGEDERLAYGKSLLDVVSHASAPAHLMQTATAMNETKEQLKQRVNFIVKKPKRSIVAAICMVLACAIVAGCAAAGPAPAKSAGTESGGTMAPTAPTGSTDPAPSESTESTEPADTTAPTVPEPTGTTSSEGFTDEEIKAMMKDYAYIVGKLDYHDPMGSNFSVHTGDYSEYYHGNEALRYCYERLQELEVLDPWLNEKAWNKYCYASNMPNFDRQAYLDKFYIVEDACVQMNYITHYQEESYDAYAQNAYVRWHYNPDGTVVYVENGTWRWYEMRHYGIVTGGDLIRIYEDNRMFCYGYFGTPDTAHLQLLPTYDADGRLIREEIWGITTGIQEYEISYEYDQNDLLVHIRIESDAREDYIFNYTYDAYGRITGEELKQTDDYGTYQLWEVAYFYDVYGRLDWALLTSTQLPSSAQGEEPRFWEEIWDFSLDEQGRVVNRKIYKSVTHNQDGTLQPNPGGDWYEEIYVYGDVYVYGEYTLLPLP